MKNYKGFTYEIMNKRHERRFLIFRFSARAVYMTHKGSILWDSWQNSRSPVSMGATIEGALKSAALQTEKWIDKQKELI